MTNYQNGKIYIITGSETEKVYLGSTVKYYLSNRLNSHRQDKDCSSQIIIDNNKEHNIVLLETYPCNSKNELLWRERYWYDLLKNIVVNKNYPIATKEEIRAKKKIKVDKYNKKRREWVNSWCGDPRYHNNLLSITLFD